MDESTRHTFQVHLPGLLKVLAAHLYGSKTVAVRELLQNAHDSCVRRTIETPESGYEPRIDLSVDPAQGMLTITDNGSGLNADEIATYLATIGRSYTRELREQLAIRSDSESSGLIGQFGFGFLSAFLIASEVTVTTRSARPHADAMCWRSVGDEYYALESANRPEPGTTIALRIKPVAAYLLQRQLLIAAVRKYADFLPVAIYVEGGQSRVNLMTPPWVSAIPHLACVDYAKRAFEAAEPLCIIPLHDQRIDLGHDTLTIALQGFLFVPPNSIASVREYGDLRVYIRRMFICDGEQDLLPQWARFVRGVIDCPSLQPTASREGVHQDDAFEAVQRALEQQLTEGLKRLAIEDPTTWRTLVKSHSAVIMGWAVRDNGFFDQVANLVVFSTSRGSFTLPEYLDLSGGTLYAVTTQLGSLQEKTLAEGYDVPVIDASWFAVEPFLEKYAAQRPGVDLVRLDGEAGRLLKPVSEGTFALLLEQYRRQGIRARVAAFKPIDMPALVLYPRNADLVQERRRTRGSGDTPTGLDALVGAMIDHLMSDEEDTSGILYLNADCPIMRRLAADTSDLNAAVLTVVHQTARLFAGHVLTPADVANAYGKIGDALATLLDRPSA